MQIRRGWVRPLLGAVGVVIVAAVAVGWWASGGRLGSSAGAERVVRPEDVAACGPAWRVVDAPNPSKVYDELHALAASSPNDIWSVGTVGTEEFALTLIEQWDGKAWSQVPSPSVEGYSNHLYSVAARSADDVWAVGASHQGTDLWRTLTLHWDGKEWRIVPSPNIGPISALNGVVALVADNVWAVGETSMGSKGTGSRSLIEHWDGKTWSIVPVAGGTQSGALNAVAAVSGDDIWAAGSSVDAAGKIEVPVFLHWDGKRWSDVPVASAQGTVWSLAAVSKDDVWAVGNNGPQALAFHWDGARWSPVAAPNPSPKSDTLNGVAAAGQDVRAVGSQRVEGADRPLAARWDGKSWVTSPSPSVGNYEDTLNAVLALPSGEAWAVGSTIADAQGTNHVLVERYSEPCP